MTDLRQRAERIAKKIGNECCGPLYDETLTEKLLESEFAEVRRETIEQFQLLEEEMRGELRGKTTPIIHEAATLHWADRIRALLPAEKETHGNASDKSR